ncbi:hypothetical protein [Rhodopirellula baltica]|uniref:Uncharacterized protein n=1 Tax=Rhodopirellula baltica SWK14 TaxID=993516 RepID=L7CC71_RHOBT|nr:hypothetical protein [Rhodopirellula baltica]ELP31237.1 hypothetical protein RBSWK_04975 [Rhodopirellula baltica SWK14]
MKTTLPIFHETLIMPSPSEQSTPIRTLFPEKTLLATVLVSAGVVFGLLVAGDVSVAKAQLPATPLQPAPIPPVPFGQSGQVPPGPFSQGNVAPPLGGATNAVDVRAQAVTGQPYGVAVIEMPLRNPVVGPAPGPLTIDGEPAPATTKIYYPVSNDVRVTVGRPPSEQPVPQIGRGRLLNRVGNLIRELTSSDDATEQTVGRRVMFLFTGDQPFSVPVRDHLGTLTMVDVRPVTDPGLARTMQTAWWDETTAAAKRQIDATDTPPWVPTYLIAMLSGRLNLPLPAWFGRGDETETEDPLLHTLEWIGGAAGVANEVFAVAAAGGPLQQTLSDPTPTQVAALPLPASPVWQPPVSTAPVEPPAIEVLAEHVPPECFYLRYGSFENYLWFRDLTLEYGGDISRMITLRGISNESAERLERQLGVQTNAMSRLLGPSVIEDQALIGRDMYLDDGASIGVLFHAKNVFLLRSSLNSDRTKLADSDESLTLKKVDLQHGPATLLRSSDNHVRSFLVEAGPCILVTNSETIADRFLEVAETGESLAATTDFQLARSYMPLERNDTIFAYFSAEMLQGLLEPSYLIELRRRMQAEADIALVRLARMAARSNTVPGEPAIQEIDGLINAGFLPENFGDRADGTGVVSFSNHLVDTRRGARGTFLPIADNPVETVTASESRWYGQIAAAYSEQFSSLDPIVIGVQRDEFPIDPTGPTEGERRERLTIHAEIAPWQPENYGSWAKQLGPPTQVAMEFAPDDVVALQAHVASETLGPPTHLFAAIKDSFPPEPESIDGLISKYRALKTLPGYLGAWPQPGALDRLPLGLGRGQPVGPGMNRLIGGLYRYTGGGFSVLSFQPDVLNASLQHLSANEVDDPAQVRGRIDSLKGTKLEGWVNQQLYERAATASLAGAEFLNSLVAQLGVPVDQAIDEAELVLGGRPQCPLGGDYQFDPARRRFVSTAWPSDRFGPSPYAPADYQTPLLGWFRGAEARLTQYPNRLIADATIEIARAQ